MSYVMHEGSLVRVLPEVKKELGLVDSQEVDVELLYKIIALNSSYLLAEIYIERAKNNGRK